MSYLAASGATQLDDSAQDGAGGGRPDVRGLLGDLFPEPAVSSQVTGRRLLGVVVQVAAVVLGAVLLLERILGVPSWDTIYGEDYWSSGRRRCSSPGIPWSARSAATRSSCPG
jgi:hypothetical protein